MLSEFGLLKGFLVDNKTALLITSAVNRRYVSGFISSAGAVLVTTNNVYLLVDFRYYEAAKRTVSSDIIVLCYSKLSDTLNDICENESISQIAVEEDVVTISQLNSMKSTLNAEILIDFNLSKKLFKLRTIKRADEIEKIKTAQKIAEKSYLELLNFVKEGVTERELAVELEYLMKKNGAEKVAFDLIVVSGVNSSLPHGVPSDKRIENGDFITFDIGAVYDGYHSDMTRTVALRSVADEMREIYDIVLKAHYKAADMIKSGNAIASVDSAARDYISEMGYGEYFGHTTGHGVGLEIHETPTVYHTNKEILEPSMVITDEPGIYLPEKFGVRIEDMYLVTENGCESLALIDKELTIL